MPHFSRDYLDHVRGLVKNKPIKEAMALSVGLEHDFDSTGSLEADLLEAVGLRPGQSIIDLGCGAGRLSSELGRRLGHSINYLGIDISEELISYARKNSPLEYVFLVNDALNIPAPDNSANIIVAFSVFTHLLHEESFIYLKSALKVLKPDGRFVFSFLELPRHRDVFHAMVNSPGKTFTMLINRPMIEFWAAELGYDMESYDPITFGQSVAVLRKPSLKR